MTPVQKNISPDTAGLGLPSRFRIRAGLALTLIGLVVFLVGGFMEELIGNAFELELLQRHGFAVGDNVGAYDPEAAERHWRRLATFFGETLG